MTTRIEIADLGLPAIDALDVDALAIFVGSERPLQGLAGFADWRLCGQISRFIQNGTYDPDVGEALLFPAGGRVAVRRIFCFGVPEMVSEEPAMSAHLRRICSAMYRARSETWACALPPVCPGAQLPVGRLLLEPLLLNPPQRLVLLGDARRLFKEIAQARTVFRTADLDIVPPVSRVEMPSRTAGLPRPGVMLR